jgi:hypothetical protein
MRSFRVNPQRVILSAAKPPQFEFAFAIAFVFDFVFAIAFLIVIPEEPAFNLSKANLLSPSSFPARRASFKQVPCSIIAEETH